MLRSLPGTSHRYATNPESVQPAMGGLVKSHLLEGEDYVEQGAEPDRCRQFGVSLAGALTFVLAGLIVMRR